MKNAKKWDFEYFFRTEEVNVKFQWVILILDESLTFVYFIRIISPKIDRFENLKARILMGASPKGP